MEQNRSQVKMQQRGVEMSERDWKGEVDHGAEDASMTGVWLAGRHALKLASE